MEPVVKRGHFVRSVYNLVRYLYFGLYFSPIFSRIGYQLQAKILEPDAKKFSWEHPLQIRNIVGASIVNHARLKFHMHETT